MRTRRATLGALAALAVTAAGVAGCGDDEAEGVTPGYGNAANGICLENEQAASDALLELETAIAEGDVETAMDAEAEYSELLAETQAKFEKLAALGDDAATLDADLTAAFDDAIAAAGEVEDAVEAQDPDAVTDAVDELERVSAQQAELAAGLGLEDCTG